MAAKRTGVCRLGFDALLTPTTMHIKDENIYLKGKQF